MARARKRETVTSQPYPYEVDETYKGHQAKIKGERGTYTIHAHEYNPVNGKHWFVLFGGPAGHECWRHKHPADVKPTKRGASFE